MQDRKYSKRLAKLDLSLLYKHSGLIEAFKITT